MESPAVTIVRSFPEMDGIAAEWRRLASTPASDPDYYRATVESAPGFVRPHVLLLRRGGGADALVGARLEEVPLPLKIGYRRLWQPTARCLTVDPGAIVGDLREETCLALLRALHDSLRRREADVVLLHQLPRSSTLPRLARVVPPRPCRDGCPRTNVRWVLPLPESREAPLPVSVHTRRLARYYTNRLARKYGPRLRIVRYADPADFERATADIEKVAARTYQRRLGVGFLDDEPTRRRIRHQMERGWFRSFLLYVDDRPCAFWVGLRYRDTYYAESTGYDPDFAADHVGKVLLAWKLDALRREEGIRRVDFGFGDADYKHHYATERHEEETVAMFAPTPFGVFLNATRTLLGSADVWLRSATTRLDLFQSIRARERRRLAGNGDGTRAPEVPGEEVGARRRGTSVGEG